MPQRWEWSNGMVTEVTGNPFDESDVTVSGDWTFSGSVTFTESANFSSATMVLPNSDSPTVDSVGEIALDTSITDYTPLIKFHDGTEEQTIVSLPTGNLSTTDDNVVKYDAANNEFTMGTLTVDQGWQLVEYADLTNGGADDLGNYDFSHTLVDGYIYRLVVLQASIDAANHVTIRLRNDAGTWLATGGDYIESGQVNALTGINNESAASFFPYNFSGISATNFASFNFSFVVDIYQAMDTSVLTYMIAQSSLMASANSARGYSSCTLATIDGHNGVRVNANAGSFDNGEAFLYRLKEPT